MQDRPFPFGRSVRARHRAEFHRRPGAFATAIEDHRAELHRHCNRLLRSRRGRRGRGPGRAAAGVASSRGLRPRARGPGCTGSPPTRASTCSPAASLVWLDEPDLGTSAAPGPQEQRPDARLLARETVELAVGSDPAPVPTSAVVVCDAGRAEGCRPRRRPPRSNRASAATTRAPLRQRARHGLRARLAPNRIDWTSKTPCAADRHTLHRYLSAVDAPNSAVARRFVCG